MGVMPVVVQIIGFFTAGFFMGRSDRRSLYQDIVIIGGLALTLPVIIVLWKTAFNYGGYMFVVLEFLQLSFFGLLGVAAGQVKQKWDLIKETNSEE